MRMPVKFKMIVVADGISDVKEVSDLLSLIFKRDPSFKCRLYPDFAQIETDDLLIHVTTESQGRLRGSKCHKVVYLGKNRGSDFYNYFVLPTQSISKDYI